MPDCRSRTTKLCGWYYHLALSLHRFQALSEYISLDITVVWPRPISLSQANQSFTPSSNASTSPREMVKNLLLALTLAALALAAPAKKGTPLSCVQYQYTGPFTSFGQSFFVKLSAHRKMTDIPFYKKGSNGFIELYAVLAQFHSANQTYTYNQTRIGLVNGKIGACGDNCGSAGSFGFEVCQDSSRDGFEGL